MNPGGGQRVRHGFAERAEFARRAELARVEPIGIARLGQETLGLGQIVRIRFKAQREIQNARDDRSRQPRKAHALGLVAGLRVHGQCRRQPDAAIVPRRRRIPLLRKLEPPGGGWDHLGQAQLGVGFDGRRLDADHQVSEVRLAGLQHG
jgi:hypothetical protein